MLLLIRVPSVRSQLGTHSYPANYNAADEIYRALPIAYKKMLQPLKCGLFVSLVKNGIALSLTLSFGISTRLFISPCSVVVFFELRSRLIAPKKSVIYQLNYLFGDTGLYLRIVQIFADCNNCTSLLLIFESLRRMHQKTLLSIVRGGWEEGLS